MIFFILLVPRFETVGFPCCLFSGGGIFRAPISKVSSLGVSSLWEKDLLVESPPYAGSGIVFYSLYSEMGKPKPPGLLF